MKDLSSTSFGLLIAFFLPGLALLVSLAFFVPYIKNLFDTFLTTSSNIGLFFLVILFSLILSLIISVFRWIIFEKIFSKGYQLEPTDFARLGGSADKLLAFRAAVDENYRYHQFWGGIAFVIPIFILGLLISNWFEYSTFLIIVIIIFGFVSEFLIGKAAIVAYRNYVKRSKYILEGGDMPNGWVKKDDKKNINDGEKKKPAPTKPSKKKKEEKKNKK